MRSHVNENEKKIVEIRKSKILKKEKKSRENKISGDIVDMYSFSQKNCPGSMQQFLRNLS